MTGDNSRVGYTRRLAVMRHAKAEPYADTDLGRRLTDRGRGDAAAAGRFLAGLGAVPDFALVSAAARTQETWLEVRRAAGATAREEISEAMYGASADAAIEALRLTPDDAATCLYVGHNPCAAQVAHLLDDGDAEPDVLRGLFEGFPPAAVAVFEVPGAWSELAAAGARLTHFHVGRG